MVDFNAKRLLKSFTGMLAYNQNKQESATLESFNAAAS